MVWPNFSLCRKGMSHQPSTAVTANATSAATRNKKLFIFYQSFPVYPLFLEHCRPEACYSAMFAKASVVSFLAKVSLITVPSFTLLPGSMLCNTAIAPSSCTPLMLTCRPAMAAA